jgi:beta-1,4-mannosyl-glycoprotein beta-1,4-N-acetylglucosaminyltransferase
MNSPRVFDCFTFNDELFLLDFRLHVLDPVVDYFVIVEADRTHQGTPKALIFHETRGSFERWSRKIIHVAVSDMPASTDAWVLENFQRRAIIRGLGAAAPSDIVMISDVDEVPNPAVIKDIRSREFSGTLGLELRASYFFLDLIEPTPAGWTPKVCHFRNLTDPHALRDSPADEVLRQAGWHLSWLATQIDPAKKLRAFAHEEFNIPRFRASKHVKRCQGLGVDLFGRFVLEPLPWSQLEGPLRDLGTSYPELLHGPRGRWSTFLARRYVTNIRAMRYLPLWLTERHPVASYLVAVALLAVSWPLRAGSRLVRAGDRESE